MSLINSILKDLDQRRQKKDSGKRSFLTDVLLSAGKSKKYKVPRVIKFTMYIALFAVAGVVGWDNYKDVIKSKYDVYISALMHSESPSVQDPVSKIRPTVLAHPVDHQDIKKAENKKEIIVAENIASSESDVSKVAVQPTISKELPLERKVQSKVQIVQATKPKPKKKELGTVAKKIHPVSKARKAVLGIEKAMRLIRRGDYQAAEKQLRRALWLQSDNLKGREILAMLLINQGRVSEAAKLLVEGLEIAPYHPPFAKLYARILVNQNETSRAIAILERAQPDIVENPEYHSFLAALYQKLSMHERAIEKYQQVLGLRPDAGNWWLGLGISLEGQGRTEEALVAYQRARNSGSLSDNIITYINSRIKVLSNS